MVGLAGEARGLRFDVRTGRREIQTIVDVPHLRLEPGELLALAGPSGSGKSTLLYLLSGLLVPSAGHVAWAGADLAAMGEGARDRWRRQNAGFVFQNFHLIDELSPLDNVLTPGWFSSLSVKGLHGRAEALLDRFGVPRDRKRVSLLSRGEQQRVAIARALLFDPEVVFADEPTASLDGASCARVVATLRDLAQAERKTVVVATHDPALLAVASRVVALDHGRVVASKAVEPAE
ncbi:ABC transporter ATP-binding protein [Mesorhizobium sp. IMUNJ 23232]|uniref:ABC transporter ATP-binding protein n=1 Tax=Mesorhizobium sp. IMUNJ 23232 TaxID=3376064 RepID=UPI00378B8293